MFTHRTGVGAAAPADSRAARRWPHPFDSALGTIALGVALTSVLLLALRLLGS